MNIDTDKLETVVSVASKTLVIVAWVFLNVSLVRTILALPISDLWLFPALTLTSAVLGIVAAEFHKG